MGAETADGFERRLDFLLQFKVRLLEFDQQFIERFAVWRWEWVSEFLLDGISLFEVDDDFHGVPLFWFASLGSI